MATNGRTATPTERSIGPQLAGLLASTLESGAAPLVSGGTSTNTMILGRQLQMEYSGALDMPFIGIDYTGYDNVTGKYTATWTDDMTTGTMHPPEATTLRAMATCSIRATRLFGWGRA